MTPGYYALVLYRGDSYHWQFTLWSDHAKTVPFDLTGMVVKSEIRERPASKQIAPLTCVVSLPNIIQMSLPAAISGTVPQTGVWDLQLTYPSGDVLTILAGAVTSSPDVTL